MHVRTLGTIFHELMNGTGDEASCLIRVGDCTAEVWRAIKLVSQFLTQDCPREKLKDCRLNVVMAFESEEGETSARQYVEGFDWAGQARIFTFQGQKSRAARKKEF